MKLLAPLCLTGFVGYLNLFGLTPFVAAIAADLDISVALVGAAITAAWLVSAAAGLVIGPIASLYGPRRTLLAGLLCIAISAAGTGIASHAVVLLMTRLIGGIGASIAAGVTLAVAADHFTGDERRRALSIISSAMAIAVMAGLLMLTTISEFAGWRGALIALGVLSIATVPLTVLFLPADPPRMPGMLQPAEILSTYRSALRGSPALLLIVACFLHGTTLTGLTTYLGAFLDSEHGVSVQMVGAVMSVLGAGYFVGTIVAGRGFGTVGLRAVYAVTAGASGMLWIVLFNAPFALPQSLAVVALVTLAAGIGWVCLITLIAEHAGRDTTLLMVLCASVLSFGSAFGSGLGGVILSFTSYQVLGISLALFVIVAAPVVWRRNPQLSRAARGHYQK